MSYRAGGKGLATQSFRSELLQHCFRYFCVYYKKEKSCSHLYFYYSIGKLVHAVSSKPIVWFRDFIGVGYRYYDIYMNVIPLFSDKMFAYKLWKKTIEWWPDDEIKLRFVEQSDGYWLIIYGGSTYKGDNTGFVKNVPVVSENYKRFKVGYEKKAILRFGIYKEKLNQEGDNNYDLEILKKSKSIYDIAFLKYDELSPDSIEWRCIEENK